ncbi:MAG: undecaprenyl-diphosphate phosphatase [bacterium]
MSLFNSIILGIVQGLTEFFPISSSAHSVIIPYLLKINPPSIFFDVCLHLGTLFAIIIFYFSRIKNITQSIFKLKRDEDAKLGFLIVIGTIPTGVIGALFKDTLEKLFESPIRVAFLLLITGVLLFLTRFFKERKEKMSVLDALIIGLFQGLAIAPGISRSGSCISSGLFLGLKRELAFDFAFLLSIPAILAAFILKLKDSLENKEAIFVLPYLSGTIIAFIIGLISLFFLSKIVRKGKIHYFAYYCWLLGILILCFL